MRIRTLTLSAGLCLVAAACGSDASSLIADEDRPTSFEDIEYESPIADFLGQDTNFDFNSDEQQAELAESERKIGESTTACMREEGFQYTHPVQDSFQSFEQGEELPFFSEEWVAKYGFGLSTQRFSQSQLDDTLVGYNDSFDQEAQEYEDPNQEYVDSLNQTEQEAYFEALYGQEPAIAEDATEAEIDEILSDFQPDGCLTEAYEENSPFGGVDVGNFYEEFQDDLEDMEERADADPRVVEYRSKVTACVADKGFAYTNMDDLNETFEKKMEGIEPDYDDPFEAAGLDVEEMTPEQFDEFAPLISEPKLDAADLARLAEIQTEELALAAAVVECDGGPLNEAVILEDIRVEHEQEFLETNADRLAEFEGVTANE